MPKTPQAQALRVVIVNAKGGREKGVALGTWLRSLKRSGAPLVALISELDGPAFNQNRILNALLMLLHGAHIFQGSKDHGAREVGVLTFGRRLRIVDYFVHQLTPGHGRTGGTQDRWATVVRAKYRGRLVAFISTHASTSEPGTVLPGLVALVRKLRSQGYAVVLGGDMNQSGGHLTNWANARGLAEFSTEVMVGFVDNNLQVTSTAVRQLSPQISDHHTALELDVAPKPRPRKPPKHHKPPKPVERPTTLFGIDVSNWQAPLAKMLGAVRSQGYHFVLAKVSEGTSFVDQTYPAFHAAAKKAGIPFGAYHFLHAGQAETQAHVYANHVGDKNLVCMLDLEAGGAHVSDAEAFRTAAKGLGIDNFLLYIPHWYWQLIGSPDLTGWQIVSSAYPSRTFAYGSALYPGDRADGWAGYGNAAPAIYQFADSVHIDGYSGHVDGDAFKGKPSDLLRLFNQ